MGSWILKAAFQKTLSALPYGERMHHYFQRHISKSLRINPAFFEDRLERCNFHLQAYKSLNEGNLPNKVLEIGTGWFPVVPIGLYLCGVNDINSIDIKPLLKKQYLQETIDFFLTYMNTGKLSEFLPQTLQEDRVDQLSRLLDSSDFPFVEICKKLNFQSICSHEPLEALRGQRFDLICSNNTLEHVPKDQIERILKENRQLLAAEGVVSHYIDLVDHYSYLDPSIPSFNFLQYSSKKWNLIENSFQSQNRLRFSEYLSLFRQNGLTPSLIYKETYPPTSLPESGVHKEYRNSSNEDLCVAYTQLVVKNIDRS